VKILIDIIVPIFHPDLDILREVIYGILNNNIKAEYRIRVITADPVPEIQKWVGFQYQEGYPLGEWNAVKQAYDESTAEYVAICHQDDYWLKDKITHQLRVIGDHKLCMTAFIYSFPDYKKKHQRLIREKAIPNIDGRLGLWNCMPSTWLLNKKTLPTLSIPYDNGITYCMDQAIAMSIGDIVAIRDPYVIYNDISSNQNSQSHPEIILRAQNRLAHYFLTQKHNLTLKVVNDQ
jgi:hypothetical protein